MVSFDEKIKKIWEKDFVRDATAISGVTLLEYVTENVILSNIKDGYRSLARVLVNVGSNAASYYLGKSYSASGSKEEKNKEQDNKNGK
ncbi:MAG: hypothetical protein QXK76_02165 [Candidatus Woesearchaeota archaeon]